MNKTFKLVIVGGGSTYTPGIVKSLLDKKDSFKLSELRLYDNLKEQMCIRDRRKGDGPPKDSPCRSVPARQAGRLFRPHPKGL